MGLKALIAITRGVTLTTAYAMAAMIVLASLPAHAAVGVSIERKQLTIPRGVVCQFIVSNRSKQFVSMLRIQAQLGPRHRPLAMILPRPPPPGWFDSEGATLSSREWLGETQDVVISPGKRLAFELALEQRTDAPIDCSLLMEPELTMIAARPPRLPSPKLHLTLSSLIRDRPPDAQRWTVLVGQVELGNDGPGAARVDLGNLLGKGVMCAENLQLELSRGNGTEPIRLDGTCGHRVDDKVQLVGAIGGRIDPLDAMLPAGAKSSLEVYWFGQIPAGDYQARLTLNAGRPRIRNGGEPLLRRWTGTVAADPVSVPLP